MQNDIAMIKLKNKVVVSQFTDFISLPRNNVDNTFLGSLATIQGMGKTSDNSGLSKTLKFVTMPVVKNAIVIF